MEGWKARNQIFGRSAVMSINARRSEDISMARYFFDVTSDGDLIQDEEGDELDGLQAARAEAIAILPGLARDLKTDVDQHTLAVTARDVTGKSVFRAKLSLNCVWLE